MTSRGKMGGALPTILAGLLFLVSPTSPREASTQEAGSGESPADAAPYPLPPDGYQVFTGTGETSSITAVIAAARETEVLLLGEMHDDRVGHAVQYELFRALLDADGRDAQARSLGDPDTGEPPAIDASVVLSLEMFERDVQYVLDEYLAGLISGDHLLESARPWPFYEEDYRPLVELARLRGTRVVAANAPRRYVNMVTRGGPSALDALSAQARQTLPPLPYAAPSAAYRAKFDEAMTGHTETPAAATAPRHGVYAQALWDAGMAYSIAESLMREPSAPVVHLVGSFHVSWGVGLPEHLLRYRPGTRMVTVVMQPASDRGALPESLRGMADFVVLTDSAHVRPRPDMSATSSTNGWSERIVSLGASTTGRCSRWARAGWWWAGRFRSGVEAGRVS